MEEIGKKIIKLMLPSFGCFLPSLFIFVIFLVVFIVTGVIVSANDGTNGSALRSGECGFTIADTPLTEREYEEKLESYAKSNPAFQIFADNASDIYRLAKAKGVNPELVPIRAQAENRGKMTGLNNYWGINCTNSGQGKDCRTYSSFEEGYTDLLNIVSKYDSLASMMYKYAYIGDYWYTLDTAKPESDGGCYYAPHIYADNMPSQVARACSASAPSCVMNGSTANCTPTTDEDQLAYAKWQVENSMTSIRKSIFGEIDESFCTGGSITNFDTLSKYNMGHSNLKVLNKKLSSSEVSSLNNFIDQEVNKAGYGTGAAVAAAGQALTYGLEKMGYYLQYKWGGGHAQNFVGVNPNWGSNSFGCDSNGRCYNGMDCSGFVSWAIRTACNPAYGSKTTYYMKHGPSINISKVKPGDLMLDADSHVRLVLKNNGNTVIVAEEAGGSTSGLVFNQYSTVAGYEFIDMSDYYKKNCKSSR